jgi:hypothetical protein
MYRFFSFLLVSVCFTRPVPAQTFDRWAQVVGWDGVSHWTRYMITQPAFMGPNALPVPQVGNGSIDSNHYLGASVTAHFSPGDHTQNLTLYGNYCLQKERLSFDIMWVPYERFTLSPAIKDKRHVFVQFYNDREAMGEVHLNTRLQLLNRWRKHIHLALRLGYRFPAGSGYGAARNTDAPGYYMDLSFGKPLGGGFRWTGMLGFYAWHLQSDQHNQNDAFLFGTGLEWNRRGWRLQAQVAGYLGYMYKRGDKPIVARLQGEKRLGKSSLFAGLQRGLQDFSYTSAEAGCRFYFPASVR